MKAVNVIGNKVAFADEKYEKQNQRQSKLAALADKKAKGKLTLEDIDEKLNIILEILQTANEGG